MIARNRRRGCRTSRPTRRRGPCQRAVARAVSVTQISRAWFETGWPSCLAASAGSFVSCRLRSGSAPSPRRPCRRSPRARARACSRRSLRFLPGVDELTRDAAGREIGRVDACGLRTLLNPLRRSCPAFLRSARGRGLSCTSLRPTMLTTSDGDAEPDQNHRRCVATELQHLSHCGLLVWGCRDQACAGRPA